MRKNLRSIGLVTGSALVLGFPFLASAQLSTSTAETITVNAVTDLGTVLATVIPAILAIVIGLMALGMGIRYARKYISGRKF